MSGFDNAGVDKAFFVGRNEMSVTYPDPKFWKVGLAGGGRGTTIS